MQQTAPTAPPRPSRISGDVGLLRREQGATLAELVESTAWQPHTVRATLTGLKKGHTLEKTKRDDVTCYRIGNPILLRLALAWELQAKVHGGLSRRTQQRLGQLATAKTTTKFSLRLTRCLRPPDSGLVIVGLIG